MTRAVVDASVAVKWFVPQPLSNPAERVLATYDLTAPTLIFAEIGNALGKYFRANLISQDAALAVFDDLETRYFAPVELDEKISRIAIEIALSLSHPIYDCYYLALCRSAGLPLISDDRKLLSKASSAGFDVIALATS